VVLSENNGGTDDDYDGTVFDDEAMVSIVNGTGPFDGDFIPQNPLSAFDGEQSAGVWTLIVEDDALFDTGTLNAWAVLIASAGTIDGDTDGSFFCVDCDDTDILNSPDFVEVCDGQDNDCDTVGDGNLIGSGDDEVCSGLDCDDILTSYPSSVDGFYWIDPLTSGTSYEVFCDQQLDAGGWTMVAYIDDVNDPYFGGHTSGFYGTDWVAAWESDSVRNDTVLPDYTNQAFVTAKYRAFSEIVPTDIKIIYMDGVTTGAINAPYFVGLGLTTLSTLDVVFATPPAGRGLCTETFASATDGVLTGGTNAPFGLNCSDSNEDWYDTSPGAENARIGGQDADFSLSMNAWLGAMGDRGFSTSLYEKTWGEYSTGAVTDRDILLFVR
jgi:hypothetical protein